MTSRPGDVPGAARGPLGRGAMFVYWHLVVGVLLSVASIPSVVLLLLLERRPGNAALVPLCLVPYGPALSAALYALRARTLDDDAPVRAYLRGLRRNLVDVLRVWGPSMVLLAVVVGSAVAAVAAGLPLGYVLALAVLGLLVVVWAVNGLVIASFYAFRARDVARIAAFYLLRPARTFTGTLALVVVAVGLVWQTTEAVLWLVAVVFVAFVLESSRPLTDRVTARFTSPG